MKRKSKGKVFLICLLVLVLCGAAGVGVWYATNSSGDPVNVYPFTYIGMTEYWGDSQESYGYVQTDKVQTVFLSDTQQVTEVLVHQGDTVQKGDVLMTFDTTLSDLALERKRLDVEKLKLQLEDAKDRLYEINTMKPMVIPEPEDEEEEKDLGTALKKDYKISSQTAYDGSSEEKAMICWLKNDTAIDDTVLDALLIKATEYQAINAEKEKEEPEKDDKKEKDQEDEESNKEDSDKEGENTEPPIPDQFYVVFKVTEKNMSLGDRLAWQGMLVLRDPESGNYRFQFFDASGVTDHMIPKEDVEETPEIDYGSGYTAAQIAEMRAEQEKAIRDLEFDIKMAEAEYQIMQLEVSDGNVYATVDGVVTSLLTEEEAQMTQQPLIKVSGGGGFYVEGAVSELDRDTMVIGSEVTINDWNTGMTYVGYVESVGDYPTTSDYWTGIGNPNTTYFPFTVFVEESADMQSGSYVNILFSPSGSENGVYLENPFLRTENGKSYVYVMDAAGKLEQRFVTTGKSLWGSYTEILEGVTAEDLIAFPYGKEVKPGADAVEADISELYG